MFINIAANGAVLNRSLTKIEMNRQPKIEVGILADKELKFCLSESYSARNVQFEPGDYYALVKNGEILPIVFRCSPDKDRW